MLNEYTIQTHSEDSLRVKPSKAPFGYFGAKLRISKQIIDQLPPHHAWVEGFCGSAAVTFAKAPVPIEVINDIDGDVVNLFNQLRNNPEKLCNFVALTPYSRAEFQMARKREKGISSLERARRFLVATMMTVNATYGSSNAGFSFSQSYARGNKEARVNRWYNLPERLESVVERLRGMRIENLDACDLVRMFNNRPATLMYLDPPYFTRRQHRYTIDANNIEFHLELLNACQQAQCMILISGYENDLYNTELTKKNGWDKRTIKTHTRGTSGKVSERTEVLWMNAQFTKAKKKNQVPIQLSVKERKENKLNPTR